jgi:simple sugar transport system substrate-binding protein
VHVTDLRRRPPATVEELRSGHVPAVEGAMKASLKLAVAVASAALVATIPMAAMAQDAQKEFYVVTHGLASDPYWVIVNNAAEKAGTDLGAKVNVSFSGGDIAAQKESFNAAIAAGADGIAVSSPETGAFVEETQKAIDAGIPVVFLDTDDTTTARLAYVGANLFTLGSSWADYLIKNGLIKQGDHVWMPVEVPGAAYQVLATEGVKSVLDPAGITWDVFDAGYDPAQSLANMTDFLTANHGDVNAIIGLGDLVMTNIKPAFQAAGIEKGSIPVVGWGSTNQTANEVKEGWVNAATWAYPDAAGYDSVMLLWKAATGLTIGYDINTQTLYDATTADKYIALTQ